MGDVVAILLPVLVVVVVLGAVLVARRRREWLVVAASALVMGLVAVVGPWLPAAGGTVAPGAAVTVGAANVMGVGTPGAALLAARPDVLVVSEYTPALALDHPYREIGRGGPGVAVLSRFPITVLEGPGPTLPGLRVRVDGPAGPFVVYALHVPRPWLTDEGGYQATVAEHHAVMAALAARVAAEPGPVVVAGDLNSPDRGRDYRLLVGPTHLVDAARAGAGSSFTSTGKWLPLLLRIDHILVTPGWCGEDARQIDLPGSDHRGVTATVGPCVGSAP